MKKPTFPSIVHSTIRNCAVPEVSIVLATICSMNGSSIEDDAAMNFDIIVELLGIEGCQDSFAQKVGWSRVRRMDADMWWFVRAYGLFVLFNIVAIVLVLAFHKRQWRVDLSLFRHYTSLVFQICGIIYALFLSFIVWDVWERYYDVKVMIQDEAKYLVDLYGDSRVFGQEQAALFQADLSEYLEHIIHVEWHHMEEQDALTHGDKLINNIWDAYYTYTPTTEKERIWYEASIDKLDKMAGARLSRLFNNSSSVGYMRWLLLIVGGLFLISIPCFFKIDLLFFKLLLVLFLANIIAFMLFIIYSLDHPFVGHVEIHPEPLEYAFNAIRATSHQ